jgi:hypothetical protein
MREPGPGLYQVLEISRAATAVDITRAYWQRARSVHPDTAPPARSGLSRYPQPRLALGPGLSASPALLPRRP